MGVRDRPSYEKGCEFLFRSETMQAPAPTSQAAGQTPPGSAHIFLIKMHKRGLIDLDNATVTADRLGNYPRGASLLKSRAKRAPLPLDRTENKSPGTPSPPHVLCIWPVSEVCRACGACSDHSSKKNRGAGAIGQTSVLSRADSAMKPNISSTQTVRFHLPLGASCQPSAQIATEFMPDPRSLTAGRR